MYFHKHNYNRSHNELRWTERKNEKKCFSMYIFHYYKRARTHTKLHCQIIFFLLSPNAKMINFSNFEQWAYTNTRVRTRIKLWKEHWHMILIRYWTMNSISNNNTCALLNIHLCRGKKVEKFMSNSIFIVLTISLQFSQSYAWVCELECIQTTEYRFKQRLREDSTELVWKG